MFKNEAGVVRKNWGGTPPLPISSPASQRRVGQDLRDNVRKGHTKAVPLRWFAFESRRVLGKIAKAEIVLWQFLKGRRLSSMQSFSTLLSGAIASTKTTSLLLTSPPQMFISSVAFSLPEVRLATGILMPRHPAGRGDRVRLQQLWFSGKIAAVGG